jgi:uncharacterized membrane protein
MSASLDALVEFLFKYRPVVFERGELSFGTVGTPRVMVVLLATIALVASGALLTRRVRGRPQDRVILGALRIAAVLLLVLALMQPQVVVAESATRANVLAVLVDESRSMLVPDGRGQSRADAVRSLLAAEDGLLSSLGSRFQVRLYGYGRETRRLRTPAELEFDSPRTALAGALENVVTELDGQALAGLVVVGDGGDDGAGDLSRALRSLRARKVPVFTVLSNGEPGRDVSVAAVEIPDRAVRGSAADARVAVEHRGLGGATVRVVAEDEGRVVAVRDLTLPRSGRASVSLPVPMYEEGARRIRFRVSGVEGDQVAGNNERLAVVRVDATPLRILYFEGEPRPEAKFVRQAVAGDRELQVVLLQRTADDKYLRLGVRDSVELATGFPTSREELFQYDAIILGSVEASEFSFEQLRMIEDFVGTRGGGLLLVGGRRALGEGGFANTPVSVLSPLTVPEVARGAARLDTVFPRLTAAGREHSAVRLGSSADSAERQWRGMPAVTLVNNVGVPKPGAVTLLTDASGRIPLLAYQRFGAGRSAILLAQDSWIWQMHADVPLEDQSHEAFWRQLLRWLAGDSPGRLTTTVARPVSEPGESVELRAAPHDARFSPVGDAMVTATVRTPSGLVSETVLTLAGDGRYTGFLTPDEPGLWRARVSAFGSDESVESDEVAFAVEESRDEFFSVQPGRETFARVASVTGGRSYDIGSAGVLPEEIVYASAGASRQERKDLWDAPALLLALLTVLGAEWSYRRWRGLA